MHQLCIYQTIVVPLWFQYSHSSAEESQAADEQ